MAAAAEPELTHPLGDTAEHREPVPAARLLHESYTLLELVKAIHEVTDDEREVVATIRHLLRSGRVRLCGSFRGQVF